jgi:hypothetical protein
MLEPFENVRQEDLTASLRNIQVNDNEDDVSQGLNEQCEENIKCESKKRLTDSKRSKKYKTKHIKFSYDDNLSMTGLSPKIRRDSVICVNTEVNQNRGEYTNTLIRPMEYNQTCDESLNCPFTAEPYCNTFFEVQNTNQTLINEPLTTMGKLAQDFEKKMKHTTDINQLDPRSDEIMKNEEEFNNLHEAGIMTEADIKVVDMQQKRESFFRLNNTDPVQAFSSNPLKDLPRKVESKIPFLHEMRQVISRNREIVPINEEPQNTIIAQSVVADVDMLEFNPPAMLDQNFYNDPRPEKMYIEHALDFKQ